MSREVGDRTSGEGTEDGALKLCTRGHSFGLANISTCGCGQDKYKRGCLRRCLRGLSSYNVTIRHDNILILNGRLDSQRRDHSKGSTCISVWLQISTNRLRRAELSAVSSRGDLSALIADRQRIRDVGRRDIVAGSRTSDALRRPAAVVH